MSATWYGVTALICLVAGVGGLVKAVWYAAIFFIPAVWAGAMAARTARPGNV